MKTASVKLAIRNGWYYAVLTRPHGQGRAIRHWLQTKSETEAWQKVKEQKLEELARVDAADAFTREVWTRMIAGRRVTIRNSIDAYREHRTITGRRDHDIAKEQATLDMFVRFVSAKFGRADFGNAQIAQIDSKHISAWINADDGCHLTTRKWRLTIVTTWLEWNASQRWLVKNPAVDVVVRLDALSQEQLIPKPHVAFTDDEVKALLAFIPRSNFWHGATLFGFHFGLRIGAVATLEDVNTTGHILKVYTKKGERMVNERMPDDVIAWMEDWKKVREPSDMNFHFPVQAALYMSRPAGLSEQFTRLCKRAGIQERSFHGLRKAATHRVWANALSELGDEKAQALAKMVATHGYMKVQSMLAHAPGSSVTDTSYLPKSP